MRRSRDMVSIIKNRLIKFKKFQKKKDSFTEEKAFNFLVCALYCYKTLDYEIEDNFQK